MNIGKYVVNKSISCPNEVGVVHKANRATTYQIFFGSNWVPFSIQLGTFSISPFVSS